MTGKNIEPSSLFLLSIMLLVTGNILFSQTDDDYVYYKNFVFHANSNFCQHVPPEASFTAYLNGEDDQILLETSPRWKIGGEPNIAGNGTFGVELGNFANPAIAVGDSVFIRFTCNSTSQQGVLASQIAGIPWFYFPSNLYLSAVNVPDPPQNLTLTKDTTTFYRTISWDQQTNLSYDVYRRAYSDTIAGGIPRMQYFRIGEGFVSNFFIDSSATASEKYGYVVYAVSGTGIKSAHSQEVNEDPYVYPGMDLTIGYIARLPRIDYVWGSTNPAIEGWPAVGSPVTWRAVVRNWSDSSLVNVPYKWCLDGSLVDSGMISIPVSDTAHADFLWTWTFDRHTVKFIIDAGNVVAEEEEENNELSIFTDAITAGFYVEQSVYDYFHQYQHKLGVHSNSWEDWAQRHVRFWNEMFANAIFPDSPNGVLDRIRIDRINVVPDGALPLAGGLPSNHPNLNDLTVDLQWGFNIDLLSGTFYSDHTTVSMTNPFYFEGSLLHELGHARYLIDLYGFNVHDNGSGNTVAITENGQLIVGTPYMPFLGGAVYFTEFDGLMNGQYTYVDEYSVPALNLIAGHRATYGNYNAPGNIGVFMQDLPTINKVTIKDNNGNVLPNASVQVYQAAPQAGVWYGKFYDDIPDLQFTTDNNGVVTMGRCPFSADGQIHHTLGHSNGVMILRVDHYGSVGYGFMESTYFNMEYWRGNTEEGNYSLKVNLIPPASVADNEFNSAPEKFTLYRNFPNPFNPLTKIQFEIPYSTDVSLIVYDILGQKIKTLLDSRMESGNHSVTWDGFTDHGTDVPSGVYFYRLKSAQFDQTRKMIMMR